MKNHEWVDGKLLQTNKKYSHLKQKQKEKIYQWMYEAYRDRYMSIHKYRKTRPEMISLNESFFGADENYFADIRARVIYDSKAGDIINQFIVFSKVFDEQRALYPDDKRKAVQETIRICRARDVLKDYLEREEAATVMFAFADQEKEMNRALRHERSEGEKIGEERGENRLAALIRKLNSLGRDDDVEKALDDKIYRAKLFEEFQKELEPATLAN